MERLVSLIVEQSLSALTDNNADTDYVWLDPKTGEIRCWINNLPEPWSPAGNNDGVIGSGAGAAASIFLAVRLVNAR